MLRRFVKYSCIFFVHFLTQELDLPLKVAVILRWLGLALEAVSRVGGRAHSWFSDSRDDE